MGILLNFFPPETNESFVHSLTRCSFMYEDRVSSVTFSALIVLYGQAVCHISSCVLFIWSQPLQYYFPRLPKWLAEFPWVYTTQYTMSIPSRGRFVFVFCWIASHMHLFSNKVPGASAEETPCLEILHQTESQTYICHFHLGAVFVMEGLWTHSVGNKLQVMKHPYHLLWCMLVYSFAQHVYNFFVYPC